MATLKCKMCGEDLEVQEGSNVSVCQYCSTLQTVPTLDNEKKTNLFNRANRLRFNNEFDKASEVYESIADEFPEEAEAYWGLVLCKYGIGYVDDTVTANKIPVCNRASYDSVLEDEKFDLIMEYADVTMRKVYRDEAKRFEELRKEIIEISEKEKAVDIFICYKEKDEDNQPTLDSAIAKDIYTVLSEKGYDVFLSENNLKEKSGQECEPYIFAALQSAKIMLAIGTDYESYNDVWVKNEWGRFLKLISEENQKSIIPCYKDIDEYDMPKEFVRLQGQDMKQPGAMSQLVSAIEEIVGVKEKSDIDKKTNAQVEANSVEEEEVKPEPTVVKEEVKPEPTVVKEEEKPEPIVEEEEEKPEAIVAEEETKPEADEDVAKSQEDRKAKANSYLEQVDILVENEEWDKASDYCEKAMKLDPNNAITYVFRFFIEFKIKAFEDFVKIESDISKNENLNKAMDLSEPNLLKMLHQYYGEYKKVFDEKRRQEQKKLEKERREALKLRFQEEKERMAVEKEERQNQAELNIKNRIELFYKAIGYGSGEENNLKVGQIIPFGEYYKTSIGKMGNIDWIVAEIKDNRALLVSNMCIDTKRYHQQAEAVTWEQSDVRYWLNNDFLNEAFVEEEQKWIISSKIETLSKKGKKNIIETEDKIFLLSEEEVEQYSELRDFTLARATAYAKEQGVNVNCISDKSWWWLRSPGDSNFCAAGVNSDGTIDYAGDYVYNDNNAIRPALWINLK